jgi:hypothetical protein
MPDLERLRELGEQVRPPEFDDLVATARRRDRRTVRAATAAAVAVLVVVAGGALAVGRGEDAAPPVQEPTPSPSPNPSPAPTPTLNGPRTSMTPEEVLAAPDRRLELTAVALGDPDVRMALWVATCHDCPKEFSDPPSWPEFRGLVLTTDGYRTTTVVKPPFPLRNQLPVEVHSPRDDMFLLVDSSNGGQWLQYVDGRQASVLRTRTPIEPDDPRQWFECYSYRAERDYETSWCSFDPTTGVAYEAPVEWAGSVVPPGDGREAWGRDPMRPGGGVDAWWVHDGQVVRREAGRILEKAGGPEGRLQERVETVGSPPGGDPTYWRWSADHPDEVELLVVKDRSRPWQVQTRAAPPAVDFGTHLARTPEGALLAWNEGHESDRSFRVWRAEGERDLERVYDGGRPVEPLNGSGGLRVLGDRLHLSGPGASILVSEDDGRSWTAISTWQ